MSVDHKPDSLVGKQALHAARPATRIAAYVGKKHADALGIEDVKLGAFPPHHSVVRIAADCPYRGNGAKALHNIIISDVAGVPYLVAGAEVESIAVVPQTVGVAQYSDFLHIRQI